MGVGTQCAQRYHQEHIRGRSVELRGTAFDFEHLFSNSVYGHPLHGEYPLRSDNTSAYVRVVRSRLYVRAYV